MKSRNLWLFLEGGYENYLVPLKSIQRKKNFFKKRKKCPTLFERLFIVSKLMNILWQLFLMKTNKCGATVCVWAVSHCWENCFTLRKRSLELETKLRHSKKSLSFPGQINQVFKIIFLKQSRDLPNQFAILEKLLSLFSDF